MSSKIIIQSNIILVFVSSLHGYDLLDYLINRRTYSERDAALIIRSLVDSLKHLHSRNIAHLDVKVIPNALINHSYFGSSLSLSSSLIIFTLMIVMIHYVYNY